MTSPTPSPLKLWLPYILDIVAPFATYLLVSQLGVPAVWALIAGGVVAVAGTVINTIRRGGLDAVGGLVVLELAASVAILLLVHDARLLLIRPSVYSGLAALWLIGSAVVGKPLSYEGARPMATGGDPVRLAAYERTWATSAAFRNTHRLVTAGIGLALAADSVLRVVIVYNTPVDRALWLSNAPYIAAVVLIVASSALAGRRFKRLVEQTSPAKPDANLAPN